MTITPRALATPLPFIEARNFTKGPRDCNVDLLVIHTMESPEDDGTAEAVAKWFGGSTAPQASAHYCIDDNSAVQSVHDYDIAWHAPNVNHNGIGFELAGRAAQGAKEWGDPYSLRLLGIAAWLVGLKARQFDIPIQRLSAPQLLAGRKGIIGHVDATNAYKTPGGHTDPGANFPWVAFLKAVGNVKQSLPVHRGA